MCPLWAFHALSLTVSLSPPLLQELRTLQATLEHLGHSQQQKLLLQQNQQGAAGIDATSYGLAQKLDQLRRAS